MSDRKVADKLEQMARVGLINHITVVRRKSGFERECVNYLTSEAPIISEILLFLKTMRIVKNRRFDLIHGFLFFPHGLFSLCIAKITGIKAGLSMIAGPIELISPGRSPIGKHLYNKPIDQSLPKYKLKIIDSFDFITVTGTYTKDYLIRIGIDENKIFVLPNIVDDTFIPLYVEKKYHFGTVSRLARVKHIEEIIEITKIIKQTIPDVRVAIAGDGECQGYLEKSIIENNLESNIEMLGHIENVHETLNEMKIFLNNSEREGFPCTVIESMKCGVPVITSDCGDIKDVVKDGVNGFVINRYDDHEKYVQRILSLLEDDALYNKIRDAGIKDVESMSLEEAVRTWRRIFLELERHGRP